MSRLLLLIALIAALIFLLPALRRRNPAQRRRLYWQMAMCAAAMLLIFLAATGRLHWLGALIGATLPFLRQLLDLAVRYGPHWLRYRRERTQGGPQQEGQHQHRAPSPDAMGRDEALATLGLSDDASREDIVQAHRRLIQRLHPDRGGNDYLAAKINRAKDVLLG